MATTPKTATTAEIAAELGTTPRELRKYLRSADKGVGKGSRYALPANKTEMTKLRKGFNAWTSAEANKKAEKAETTEPVIEDNEEIMDDDDIEPTDDELDEIDDED